MLSISLPLSTPDYLLSLARADYYTAGGEPPGQWFGSGAQALGLTGTVKPKVLRQLFRGLSPDGQRKLVRNAVGTRLPERNPPGSNPAQGKDPGKGAAVVDAPVQEVGKGVGKRVVDGKAPTRTGDKVPAKDMSTGEADGQPGGKKAPDLLVIRERQGGWDLTFSAPKSVSALFAIAPPSERETILQSQEAAVKKTLADLEKEIGFSRRGPGGILQVPAKLAFALYLHVTSRAQDPQIHSHCVLLNVGVREDGTTGTIVSQKVFRWKMLAGALYRVNLARELRSRLGLSLRTEKTWFQIEGVPAALMEAFSKRRKEVLAELDRMGKSDAVSAEQATRATRKGKELTPRQELYTAWESLAEKTLGRGLSFVPGLFQKEPLRRAPLQLNATVDELLKQRSFFSREQFLLKLAHQHQTGGQPTDRIIRGGDRMLRNLVDLGVHDGVRLYTAPWVLEEEKRLLAAIEAKRDDRTHRLPTYKITPFAAKLSEEQQSALLHIVGTAGEVKVLQGWAGTGKSTLLSAARKTWEASGFNVLGAAYSGQAARGLADASGISSHTVDRLLYQWAKDESAVQRLNDKSILIVDEASMLDTLRLSAVVKAVREAGARLVLVGDEKQLPPIQGCAPFAEIGRRLGRSELRDIRRQKNGLLKLVVEELADGSVSKALDLLRRDKMIRVHENTDAARDALVADWHKAKGQRLMLAATREEVDDLNARAQAMRAKNGELELPYFTKDGRWFRRYDKLMFTRNDRMMNVQNGTVGTLIAFNPFSRVATIRVEDRHVFVPIGQYRNLELAYCMTVHKAQGATVDHAFVLWSDTMQSREMTYVQASRARHQTQFYLTQEQAGDDFRDVVKSMERRVMREMAVTKERAVNLSPSI